MDLNRTIERRLREMLAEARRDGRPRLPPVRVLARELGVCVTTLRKHIAVLHGEGLIDLQPRRGMFATGCAEVLSGRSPQTMAAHGSLKWQRLKHRLSHDLASGALGRAGGAFITVAALLERYRVSRATMRKALNSLVHEGVLCEESAGYRLRLRRPTRSLSTIVLVVHADFRSHVSRAGGGFFGALVDHVERECSRRNVRLHVSLWEYDGVTGEPRLEDVERWLHGEGSEATLGFMIADRNMNEQALRRAVHLLRRSRKPVAVMREGLHIDIGDMRGLAAPLQLFDLSHGPHHGAAVSRYLLQSGHRTIVYVMPNHYACGWSHPRYRGLAEAFLAPGTDCRVVLIAGDEDNPSAEHKLESPRWEAGGGASLPRLIRQDIATAGSMDLSRSSWARIHKWLADGAVRRLTPLFERCLRVSRATAWVCGNDNIAVPAQQFLRERGIAVPGRIAVVGFDNSWRAISNDITSYDFGADEIVRRMLAHLLTRLGDARVPGRRLRTICIQGTVVERSSSRLSAIPRR